MICAMAGPLQLIRDACDACCSDGNNEVIRVIGNPVQDAGLLIEITMETSPCATRCWTMACASWGCRR